MEQRRGDTAEHFFLTFLSLFLHFFSFFSLFITYYDPVSQGSLRPTLPQSWCMIHSMYYIPWWRMYLITIFAEHCVKIHDSWYFQGILDHVKNIDIDIKVSVTFLNESVDKKRHFNNISIPVFWAYQCYQNISWKRHFTNESIPLSGAYHGYWNISLKGHYINQSIPLLGAYQG